MNNQSDEAKAIQVYRGLCEQKKLRGTVMKGVRELEQILRRYWIRMSAKTQSRGSSKFLYSGDFCSKTRKHTFRNNFGFLIKTFVSKDCPNSRTPESNLKQFSLKLHDVQELLKEKTQNNGNLADQKFTIDVMTRKAMNRKPPRISRFRDFESPNLFNSTKKHETSESIILMTKSLSSRSSCLKFLES